MLAAAAWLSLGRGWLLVAFERDNAPAFGFRPEPLDAALFAVLAVAVVTAVDAVGALLVSSLFVVPAGTARLFTRGLLPMTLMSSGLALVAGTAGLWLAGHVDAPQGACVAAAAASLFAIALAVHALAQRQRRQRAVEAVAHA